MLLIARRILLAWRIGLYRPLQAATGREGLAGRRRRSLFPSPVTSAVAAAAGPIVPVKADPDFSSYDRRWAASHQRQIILGSDSMRSGNFPTDRACGATFARNVGCFGGISIITPPARLFIAAEWPIPCIAMNAHWTISRSAAARPGRAAQCHVEPAAVNSEH